jgi:hypothetical protein
MTGDQLVSNIAGRKEKKLRDLMEIYIRKNSIEYLQGEEEQKRYKIMSHT